MVFGPILHPIKTLYNLAALTAAVGGAFVGTQYPKFMQTYEQRLGGRTEAIQERCTDYQAEADERTGGDLEKLLDIYRKELPPRAAKRVEKDIKQCSGTDNTNIYSILQSKDAWNKGWGFLSYNAKAFAKDIVDDSYDFEKKDFKGIKMPTLTSAEMKSFQGAWKNYHLGWPDMNEPGLLWYTGAGALAGFGLYTLGMSLLKKLFSGVIKKKEKTSNKTEKKTGKQKVGKADLYKRLDNL